MKTYNCRKCGVEHGLSSQIGMSHLKYNIDEQDISKAINLSFSSGAYMYITKNTQSYLRDIRVFELLQNKFDKSGHFSSIENMTTWLKEQKGDFNQLSRFLQGHGAGEIDAYLQFNSKLNSLIYKTDFVRDASGHIQSNQFGFDLQRVNRFTGEVAEKIQVKTNWTVGNLRATVSKVAEDPSVTLAGPKELIDTAKEMNVQNKLEVVCDANGNRESSERLQRLIKEKRPAIAGKITLVGVAERVKGGAIIGAAVTCGLSSVSNVIAFKQGRITAEEAIKNIGIDSAQGAFTGGALGGLSLLFPPGAIGLGIGIVVGSAVSRLVDIAFGKGFYKDIVESLNAVEGEIKMSSNGITILIDSMDAMHKAQLDTINILKDFDSVSTETDIHLSKLRKLI